MKTILGLVMLVWGLVALPVSAQVGVPPPVYAYQPLSAAQLDQLLGPIALYPDPLIAQILPAATVPEQIVLADRYILSGGDPNLIDQQPWNASVQAVARYPNVLKWLDDNLNWTTALGQAFLSQQQDVMDSVQRLRLSAQNLGNLQSTPQQQVVVDNGSVEILPANPEYIYVPVYQPAQVYYQKGFALSFGLGFVIGGWLNHDFDWHNRHLIVWDRAHPRPPNWWHERPAQREVIIRRDTRVWHPNTHREVSAFNRGDRGWNNPPVHVDERARHEIPPPHNFAEPRHNTEPRHEPAHVEHAAPVRQPPSAFGGSHSSQETRSFSSRGHQSMQTMPHSPPSAFSHPSPPASSSSGGGGGHKH